MFALIIANLVLLGLIVVVVLSTDLGEMCILGENSLNS